MDNLTSREIEILKLLVEGKMNKEIAEDLSISLDTVKKHVRHIYKKINVRNRVGAIIYYNRKSAVTDAELSDEKNIL